MPEPNDTKADVENSAENDELTVNQTIGILGLGGLTLVLLGMFVNAHLPVWVLGTLWFFSLTTANLGIIVGFLFIVMAGLVLYEDEKSQDD